MASKKKHVDQVDMFSGGASLFPKKTSGASDHPVANAGPHGAAEPPRHSMQSTMPARGPEEAGTFALAKTEPAPALDAPERPKLRLVPPQPDEDVTIEPDDAGFFWVSFVRHDGTTRGAVRITRRQVEMLLARAPVALEMGR